MRGRNTIAAISALLLLTLLPACAFSQLTTATGRTIQMSDPAWKIFIPSTYQQRGNAADLLVHFHGDPQTYWNNAKYANLNAVIVTVNLGTVSSDYQTPFAGNTSLFQNVLNDALTTARNQTSIPDDANWRKVGVSSFSAGYAAVR